MSTPDRDQLGSLASGYERPYLPRAEEIELIEAMAQELIDLRERISGWRPPAQVIETVEQLEALPVGAVVLECNPPPDCETDLRPHVWQQIDYDGTRRAWEEPGSPEPMLSGAIELPAILLWSPTEKAGTE